jgi:hypothetical protein
MAMKFETCLHVNTEGYLNPMNHWKIMLNYSVIASRMCDSYQFFSLICAKFNTYSKYASNSQEHPIGLQLANN